MAIFDGERISARIKQFMCMIERFTTDYMLDRFLNKNDSAVKYERPPAKNIDSSRPPSKRTKKGQDQPPPQKGGLMRKGIAIK